MTGRVVLAGMAVALAGAAGARELSDIPVVGCANLAYLSDMDGRLWWNAAWRKRAARPG